MKLISTLCEEFTSQFKENKAIICEYLSTPNGIVRLETPVLSSEKSCEWCGQSESFCPFFDPEQNYSRVWLCANMSCIVHSRKTKVKATQHTDQPKRSILWPKFCEINDVGDEHHEVRFESIEQSEGKTSYLLKFATSPRGIIFMRGNPGTGKSYAAMAVCEFYTRKDTSCIFTTAKQMSNKWLNTFNKDRVSNYIERVTNCNLLVVDDFAIGEPNPKFLEFFMELINTRLQWKTRGTIITTNLEVDKFNEYCGAALSDRILTGQIFEFKGKTRRKKVVL